MEIFKITIHIIFKMQMDKLIKDKGEYIMQALELLYL